MRFISIMTLTLTMLITSTSFADRGKAGEKRTAAKKAAAAVAARQGKNFKGGNSEAESEAKSEAKKDLEAAQRRDSKSFKNICLEKEKNVNNMFNKKDRGDVYACCKILKSAKTKDTVVTVATGGLGVAVRAIGKAITKKKSAGDLYKEYNCKNILN